MHDDTWNIVVTAPDAVARDYPNILQQMADLEYSAVVIRGFYALEHCAEVVRRIESDTTGLVDVKEYVTTGGDKLELRYIGPGLGRYVTDRQGSSASHASPTGSSSTCTTGCRTPGSWCGR